MKKRFLAIALTGVMAVTALTACESTPGGSSSAALQMIKDAGAKDIIFICIISAPEGIKKISEDHPEIPIYTAAIDSHLNENAYIVPGLGDAGDRIFGTL